MLVSHCGGTRDNDRGIIVLLGIGVIMDEVHVVEGADMAVVDEVHVVFWGNPATAANVNICCITSCFF